MKYEHIELLVEMINENPGKPYGLRQIARHLEEAGEPGMAKRLMEYARRVGVMLMEIDRPGEIPPHAKAGLDAYVKDGIPTGGFLRAVLSNDLKEAFGRADIENRTHMFEIVNYVYNDVPVRCQGSWKIVNAWLKMHEERRKKVREEAADDGLDGHEYEE